MHGRLLQGNQCGPAYWAENLQRPVQFWKAVRSLVEDGHRFFVEVGPHPVLGASIVDGLKTLDIEGGVRTSLRRGEPERKVMLESLGALYEQGQSVAWQAVYPAGRHVPLPAYPWQRERFWVDAPTSNSRWLHVLRPEHRPGAHRLLGEHRELSSEPGTFLWEFEPNIQASP